MNEKQNIGFRMNDRTSTKGSKGFSKKSKVENCRFGPKLSESDQSLCKQVKISDCISCKCLSDRCKM